MNKRQRTYILLTSKILQAFHANKRQAANEVYNVGDKIMLVKLHQHWEYKAGDNNHVAKFFLKFNRPHTITNVFPENSLYTSDLPNSIEMFPTSHALLLKHFHVNNAILFPSCKHPMSRPVVTLDGVEEHMIEKIADEWKKGHDMQYLVCWLGYPPNHDQWMPQHELEDCAALDHWLQHRV